MTAYAIGRLRAAADPRHPDILQYLERIQGTLDPFGGRFLVHGGPSEVREGSWPGDTVVIGFPSMDDARSWYDSREYRRIMALRTSHIDGEVVLVQGVGPDHDSALLAARLRRARGGAPQAPNR